MDINISVPGSKAILPRPTRILISYLCTVIGDIRKSTIQNWNFETLIGQVNIERSTKLIKMC